MENPKFYFSMYFDSSNVKDPQCEELFETNNSILDRLDIARLLEKKSINGVSNFTINEVWSNYDEAVYEYIKDKKFDI